MRQNKNKEWFWTKEKTETLITMAMAGASAGEMAQATGKTKPAVSKKIGELRKGGVDIPFRVYQPFVRGKEDTTKPDKDNADTTQRKCLRCGDMFPSTHIGNRICSRHGREKSSSTWLYDNYGASMP